MTTSGMVFSEIIKILFLSMFTCHAGSSNFDYFLNHPCRPFVMVLRRRNQRTEFRIQDDASWIKSHPGITNCTFVIDLKKLYAVNAALTRDPAYLPLLRNCNFNVQLLTGVGDRVVEEISCDAFHQKTISWPWNRVVVNFVLKLNTNFNTSKFSLSYSFVITSVPENKQLVGRIWTSTKIKLPEENGTSICIDSKPFYYYLVYNEHWPYGQVNDDVMVTFYIKSNVSLCIKSYSLPVVTDQCHWNVNIKMNSTQLMALANLTRLESSNILPNEDLKTAIRSIKEFKEALPTKLNSHNEPGINQYDRTKPKPNGRGRPEFEIDISKLQQLLELGFTVKQIANDGLLGGVLHPNTLYKKLRENNIKIRSYSNIGDEDLQELVVKYNRDHPNAGAMEIQAYLKSNGHNIQRQRCRDMLLSVDSAGTATRWSRTIQRRQYSVPTANSVWHVDTHHSLARWGIVVHGAIDGYSRLIPFMRASTYNTSKAAACFFVEGVQNFGVPSRVRADHGTEYADTGRFMIQVNGEDRGSFLTGPSVHNQRIERLWRDVYMKVIDTFYKLFLYMEDEKVLDIGNEIHKWVLQYVFTPRIDAALKEWMRTHNNHKIRTENNRTPNMLWFQSLLLSNPDKFTSARNIDSPPEEKIEMAIQTLNLELDDKTFLRPRQSCPLMEDAIQDLASRIDVNKESESHGLDVFREVMLYVLLKQ